MDTLSVRGSGNMYGSNNAATADACGDEGLNCATGRQLCSGLSAVYTAQREPTCTNYQFGGCDPGTIHDPTKHLDTSNNPSGYMTVASSSRCCTTTCATWSESNSCLAGADFIDFEAEITPANSTDPAASCCESTCRPGSYKDRGRCKPCPAGTAGDGQVCEICDVGMFASVGTHACLSCEPGQYDDDKVAATECQLCPQGTFSNISKEVSCTGSCPPGTFAPTGSASVANCTECTVGQYDDDMNAATPCIARLWGHFIANTTACLACPRGQFSPPPDDNRPGECDMCPTGRSSDLGAAHVRQCRCSGNTMSVKATATCVAVDPSSEGNVTVCSCPEAAASATVCVSAGVCDFSSASTNQVAEHGCTTCPPGSTHWEASGCRDTAVAANYIGCYSKQAGTPDFAGSYTISSSFEGAPRSETHKEAVRLCKDVCTGYTYMGLRWANLCW
eukprot:COSAG02_NODE_5504_length_4276_cov_4.553986_1_plen_448_part_00